MAIESIEQIQACIKQKVKDNECKQILSGKEAQNFLEAQLKASEFKTIPFAFQVPGSSAFGLQSQSRTPVYAPSTSPLAFLPGFLKCFGYTKAHAMAQAASTVAINDLASQQKLVAELQTELNQAQGALRRADSDTQPPHWHASFIGGCTWRISPHHRIDHACVTKKEAIQNNINRLRDVLKVAQEAVPAKEETKEEADASLNNLKQQNDAQNIRATLDALAMQSSDGSIDTNGEVDASYEEL